MLDFSTVLDIYSADHTWSKNIFETDWIEEVQLYHTEDQ